MKTIFCGKFFINQIYSDCLFSEINLFTIPNISQEKELAWIVDFFTYLNFISPEVYKITFELQF